MSGEEIDKNGNKESEDVDNVTVDDTTKTVASTNAALQEKVRLLVNQLALWDAINSQPTASANEVIEKNEAIEKNTPHDEIRKDPYNLPKEFEWTSLELNNENELKELYNLLTNNYVEDDDAMFRFDYSPEFLKWALMPPGYLKVWHAGVRVIASKKLVAFVTPVLIKEITRRSHLQGIFQAVYTAGVVLPKPISKARSLNPKKLVETNFSRLPQNVPLSRYVKKYKVSTKTVTPGIREMLEKDASAVRNLLNSYMEKFDFVPEFKNDDEIKHWILPRENVVWSYVVEDTETKEITDFFSFYYLPSSVIGNPTHKTINAVYLFYYAIKETDGEGIKGRLQSLMKDALILAKLKNVDVFNCLDIMDNKVFINDLKFGAGDGYLNYYMYNWRCKDTTNVFNEFLGYGRRGFDNANEFASPNFEFPACHNVRVISKRLKNLDEL
ncbi:5136_t:CDS:2 [Entrophospora sp. SA101]|nr:5136_t:CDS:2 [Entrophospora sp. SA101]